jgi:hypothetical protein
MLDAADRARLTPAQLEAVTAAMLNLVAEVVSLADRVAAIERERGGEPQEATVAGDLVRRVLAPLAAPQPEQTS